MNDTYVLIKEDGKLNRSPVLTGDIDTIVDTVVKQVPNINGANLQYCILQSQREVYAGQTRKGVKLYVKRQGL